MEGKMAISLWNCLIQAFVSLDVYRAIEVLNEMEELNVQPNPTTYSILITACSDYNELFEEGESLCRGAKKEIKEIPIELSTSMINFYNKSGNPELAIEECEILKKKGIIDVHSWTCLIQAHILSSQTILVDQGSHESHGLNKAFEVYEEMKQFIEPDSFTFHVLLSACGEYWATDIGLKVIEDIRNQGRDNQEDLISAMLFFYSQIGRIETAQQLFDNLIQRKQYRNISSISYANMLSCYANYGKGQEAKALFTKILQNQIELTEPILVSVLNSYSNSGMTQDAIQLFQDLIEKHNFTPTIPIECAMIDVFAREGMFSQAEELIGNRNDIRFWNVLMGACRKFNNIEIGEKVFTKIVNFDESLPSPYILLSGIYRHLGLNEKLNNLRNLMDKKGIKKIPGIVTFEENGKVFKFISGSRCDQGIKQVWDELYRNIIKAGFKSDTTAVTSLKTMSDEEKLDSLSKHAEKLATVPSRIIRIFNNSEVDFQIIFTEILK